MSSHKHLWKKGFFKPNSTPVPNPLKIQRRRVQALPPPLSQKEKLQLKQQAEQISQLGYNSHTIPLQAPSATGITSSSQSNPLEVTNKATAPAADAVDIQTDALDDLDAQQETVETEEKVNSDVEEEPQESEQTIQRQERLDTEADKTASEQVEETVELEKRSSEEASPHTEAESGKQQPIMPSVQAQLEKASKFGYNGLNVPVNAPEQPSPLVQRKMTLSGLANQYQLKGIERVNPRLNGLNKFKVQRTSQQQQQQQPESETIQRLCSDCEQEQQPIKQQDKDEETLQAKQLPGASSEINLAPEAPEEKEADVSPQTQEPTAQKLIDNQVSQENHKAKNSQTVIADESRHS